MTRKNVVIALLALLSATVVAGDGTTWTYVFSLTVESVSLRYSEHLRDDKAPQPNNSSTTAATATTGGGFLGALDAINKMQEGYSEIGQQMIGSTRYRIWARAARADSTAAKEQFDGAALANARIGGTATMLGAGVRTRLVATPSPPSITFTGSADRSEEFKGAFRKKVQDAMSRAMRDLSPTLRLTDDQQSELTRGRGATIVVTKPFKFLDSDQVLKITITSERKLNIPLGSEPSIP